MAREDEWVLRLKALADKSRLRMMSALLRETLSVNDIAASADTSQYNASKHLRILREAGLVDSRVNGNRREYFIAEDFKVHLAKHRNVLDLGCCVFHFDRLPKK